ncbi:MAG: hypothetical protein HY736_15610 [Verrucomicrobia bacterium]|nr:hypothetical protein [Verrucomicrobiota bacterium]
MPPASAIASAVETRVRAIVARAGPLAAFRELVAENDALIRAPALDNGRQIAAARATIHTELVRGWAEEQQRASGYDKPFAVVALGGTGRGEMAPHSDNDFAFLFADALEGNAFLLELQRQILHTSEFRNRYGFTCLALPFSLDDLPALADRQLNAFLDLRPVHDPGALSVVFRERIRASFDSFAHFLHVRGFWQAQWEKAAGESERLDRFDIKNDGLRVFLAGVWTLAGRDFLHAHEVYQSLPDPRDLEAYDFLMRIRAFVHSRRPGTRLAFGGGHHPEDVLTFDDFLSFGEMLGPDADERARFEFANDVRARLLSARRRVALFTKGVIERELKAGRPIGPRSPIVFGPGGLRHTRATQGQTGPEKSRAALSLLLAAQHYAVPIDPAELQATFRDAGSWLERGPDLAALFYESQGLADSFAFVSQLDGAVDRLLPGFAKFECSIDSRVMAERRSLRGALVGQKLRALERYVREGRAVLARGSSSEGVRVEVEAALLDTDHLAAVKLALVTKRLPLTEDDIAVRADESRPLFARYSTGFSGIPLAAYFAPFARECDFPPEMLRVAEFLVANRRVFKERAAGLNDARQVTEFAELCRDENLLRTLFVFTCADRTEWESPETDPARWFNTRELYAKTLQRFRPAADPTRALHAAGYSPEQRNILKDFGEDFFGGVYRQYANRFGAHLVRLIEEPGTTAVKAAIVRDGTAMILGVAARDYRGLAATISGALWHRRIEFRQAHLFSAMHHGLALDFFHLAPSPQPLAADLVASIEDAILRRLYIADADEASLPAVTGQATLHEWRPAQYCLRFETAAGGSGLIYAITYKMFRHLRANIFGLTAHTARGKAFVSVYHSLPNDLPLPEAQRILADRF